MKNLHKSLFIKFRILLIVISLLAIAELLSSCEAPHDNPLDPSNANNNLGTINGVVQTFSLPFSGIPGASVYWPAGNILVKTDSKGKFTLNNIQLLDGYLIIQKEGYKTDSLIINWNGAKTVSQQINLNSIPNLDSISIYTTVINQFSPSQTFELNVIARVSDRDNDIDSVTVNNAQLSLKKKLDFNITQNYFQTTLSTNEMNISDLEEAIGLDFNIVVHDRFKNDFSVGSGKVTRVIKTPVVIQSPANSDSVSANPALKWQRFNPGYNFSYKVEVYTNDIANSQIVFSKGNISSDSTSMFVQNSLSSGDYYWVLWVMDQFQNRARSKPATFIVK